MEIDRASYELGIIAAFAEVVALGVKKLALSSPLAPEMYDTIKEHTGRIARENGIKSYLEKDLLVTDLFPEDIARDKYVIMLYADDSTLESYLSLKDNKRRLLESGGWTGGARREIAREFGRLLSYPEGKIEELLS
jgi:hypothetical protein